LRIAVDAMGGDNSPQAPVGGALKALRNTPDLEVVLTGPETLLRKELSRQAGDEDLLLRVEVVNADEVISPAEPPVRAIRRKRNSSMRVALELVREGSAAGVVSTGSTGALMAGGLLMLGRVDGVSRPAIATVLPTFSGGQFLMLDLGAHMEADSTNLLQYGVMGSLHARHVLGIDHPRVGLLNVGEEEAKGSRVYKEAYQLLSEQLAEFAGNIEGRVLFEGRADVVVCDGFVGNVVLKVIEAVGLSMFDLLRRELRSDLWSQAGALLARPAFRRVYKQVDYQEHGGAQLLGLRQPVVKCHGSAEARAIESGIRTVAQASQSKLAELIAETIASYGEG